MKMLLTALLVVLLVALFSGPSSLAYIGLRAHPTTTAPPVLSIADDNVLGFDLVTIGNGARDSPLSLIEVVEFNLDETRTMDVMTSTYTHNRYATSATQSSSAVATSLLNDETFA